MDRVKLAFVDELTKLGLDNVGRTVAIPAAVGGVEGVGRKHPWRGAVGGAVLAPLGLLGGALLGGKGGRGMSRLMLEVEKRNAYRAMSKALEHGNLAQAERGLEGAEEALLRHRTRLPKYERHGTIAGAVGGTTIGAKAGARALGGKKREE